jgi:hypothetical protein
MSTFTYHKPGIGNASSYIVSGVPWYTSSLAPALSTTSKVVNFPRVTNYVVVKNNSTTNDTLRFTFNNDNIVDNTNYVTLEGGESFSGELRTTDVHFISDTETPVPFTVVAGLTNIDRVEMSPVAPTAPNLLAWVQKQKIYHTDLEPAGDRLGYGFPGVITTPDNSIMVTSAIWDDELGTNSGASFVFKKEGEQYIQTQKITASGGGYDPSLARFGSSIGLSDDGSILALGAYLDPQNGTNAGSVYIFKSSSLGYQEIQKITSSNPVDRSGDRFGATLTLDPTGQKIAIGSAYDDSDGIVKGAVYIFSSSSIGYQEVQRITSSTAVDPVNDSFGYGLAFSRDCTKLIISTRNEIDLEPNTTGSVYIFESGSSGYEEKQNIPLSNNNQSGLFANILSTNEDASVIAVGNGYMDVNGSTYAGIVHIIKEEGGTYSITQQLTENDTDIQDNSFGFSVSLNSVGDVLCVGTRFDNENGIQAGAAYMYKDNGSGFAQVQKLIADDPDGSPEGDRLGFSVHLSGDSLFVAASYDDVSGSISGEQGSIYIFKYTRDY